mmetsp:Transcript_23880/g.51963  ORF Transcript_23880/g.51963 Transcript_23880/m.51963 type:complete len:131 (+) Transcript_23880:3243-3635(+)
MHNFRLWSNILNLLGNVKISCTRPPYVYGNGSNKRRLRKVNNFLGHGRGKKAASAAATCNTPKSSASHRQILDPSSDPPHLNKYIYKYPNSNCVYQGNHLTDLVSLLPYEFLSIHDLTAARAYPSPQLLT